MTTPQEVSSGQQQQAAESAGAESEPNSSNSTSLESGSRKRAHPASLNIDDTAPPNKRLHTPTVSIVMNTPSLHGLHVRLV